MIKIKSGENEKVRWKVKNCGIRRWLPFLSFPIGEVANIHLTLIPKSAEWTSVNILIKPKTTKEVARDASLEFESLETNVLDQRQINEYMGDGHDIEIPLTKIERHDIYMQLAKSDSFDDHKETLAYFIPTDGEALKRDIILATLNAIFALAIGVLSLYLSIHWPGKPS